MKEDILEQLVDDYLQHLGYFTRHNIKFRPDKAASDYNSKDDSVHSDIDVVGINPNFSGYKKVVAVSCKSWQNGFNPKAKIDQINGNKTVSGREAWKGFRELTDKKWADAFVEEVRKISGTTRFTYITAVTKVKGSAAIWEDNSDFKKKLHGNPIKILTLSDMLEHLLPSMNTTPASSDVGRVLQLMKASGWLPSSRA